MPYYQIAMQTAETVSDGGPVWPIWLVPAIFVLCFILSVFSLVLLRMRRDSFHVALKSGFLDSGMFFLVIFLVMAISEFALRIVDFDPWEREDLQKKNGYYHLEAGGEKLRELHTSNVKLITTEINGEPFWYYQGPRFNRLGGRGPEPSEERPDIRVVWMGNSIVFGSGVGRDETFPNLLEKRQHVQYPGKRIEHVNLAVPGYDLPRYKMALARVLPEVPADLVLLGLWHGDMIAVKLIGNALYRADVKVCDKQRFVHSLPFSERDVADWSGRSKLFLLLSVTLGNLKISREIKSLSLVDKMLRDLKDLKKLVEDNGARLAFVWFPPLDRPFEEQLDDFKQPGGFELHKELHKAASAFARAQNIPFFDVRGRLVDCKVEEIRLDTCCHFNEKGQRILSERLAPWLNEVLAVRK